MLRTYTGTTADPDKTSGTLDNKAVTDTRYEYDDLGRLTKVSLYERNDTPLGTPEDTEYRYDLAGNLDKVRLANEAVSDYDYDEMNRLVQLAVFDDSTGSTDWVQDGAENLLSKYEYDLLLDGKRKSVVETDDADAETRIDWVYDDLGRLTAEDFDFAYTGTFDANRSADYAFDLVGNRLTLKSDLDGDDTDDETITYAYDDNDRLLREQKDDLTPTNADSTTFYGYDVTQQTSKTSYDGILTDPGSTKTSETLYTYDVQGRLSQTSVDADGDGAGAAVVTTYKYDDSGIRVSQTVGGVETKYLNDKQNPTGHSQVLEEKNSAGTVIKTYTLGHDVLTQQDSTNGILHFLYDGHGSTRALLDTAAAIAANQVFNYDAYGNPIGFDPANALTSLLYSGEQTDPTGMQYLRARYYDPATGRLNRYDPFTGSMSDPQSLHKYLYAHANPIMGIDPSGQFSMAGMSSAMSIGLSMMGSVISTISSVFTVINTTMTVIDVTQLVFDIATGGKINQAVRQAVEAYWGHLTSQSNSGISDLFSERFWRESGESFARNMPRIARSLLRSKTARNTFIQATKRSVDPKFPRVIIQLPVPPGLNMPQMVVPLPMKIRLGPMSLSVGLQFGQKRGTGRVLGFAIQTRPGAEYIKQMFRQDSHDWHPFQSTQRRAWKDIRWLDRSGAKYFHYHVPK